MTLPDTEVALKNLWGEDYVEDQWWLALKAVMDAKNDVSAALNAIKKIQLTAGTISDPSQAPIPTQTPQAHQTEQELMESVAELKKRN
jgi:hypothetical protein